MSKLRKIVLISSYGEDGSCRSETKQHTTTAPKRKLYIYKKTLQEHRPQHRKSVLGSCPGKINFRSSKLSTIESTQTEIICFAEETVQTVATVPYNM
jgi:hypothetical protein